MVSVLVLCSLLLQLCTLHYGAEGFQTVRPMRLQTTMTHYRSVHSRGISERVMELHAKTSASDWNPVWMTRSPTKKKTFSPAVTANYIAATLVQWSLLFGFTKLFDTKLLPLLKPYSFNGISASSAVVACLMVLFSFRSRIFSPLNNRRPRPVGDPVMDNRKRPSWMPPPLAFPIIWTTINALRIISGTMIFNAVGGLNVKPILWFLAHLSIGDTWNTINNVDNRLGTAALGVLFVVASVYYTTYQYYLTLPRAAFVLAPSCLWLTVATALVFSIWKLNKNNFQNPSFFPSKEEGAPSKWKMPLMP